MFVSMAVAMAPRFGDSPLQFNGQRKRVPVAPWTGETERSSARLDQGESGHMNQMVFSDGLILTAVS